MKINKAFTLLEVIFAISFLIMLAMAIISLDLIGLKMMNNTEIKTVAYALQDETSSFVQYCVNKSDAVGCEQVEALAPQATGTISTVYINCPVLKVDPNTNKCSLSNEPVSVTVGDSRLKYIRKVILKKKDDTNILVEISTSWGNGDKNKIETTKTMRPSL